MDESPRFRFFSLTFLVGFGVGVFAGVALGVLAFAVAGDSARDAGGEVIAQPTVVLTVSPNTTPAPVRARTNAATDVRIGPGNEYAAVGTIARGETLDILGRDDKSEWIAVRFPPGSSAQGWLPVRVVDNLSDLAALRVALPTPLPRTIATPFLPFVQGGIGSNNGSNNNGSGGPQVSGAASTPAARTIPGVQVTHTPKPSGPPDLTVSGASLLPDGRVRVVVINRGSGDLIGHQITVVVADPTTRSEFLRAPGTGLRAGQSITLESDTFLVTVPTSVIITVDPSFSFTDADRSNNTLTVSLAPATTPTVTPTFGGE